MKTLRIDFVSDVVCPWCAIGLASLEQALQRTQGEVAADIHFQPFELNPQLPAEGEGIGEHLQRKYGMDPAQLADNQERIRARGAALGFVFDFNARSRIWNTFDAHRLLHHAGLISPEAQCRLKHALLRAYFTLGQNPGARDVLWQAAAEAGLEAAEVDAVLSSDRHAEAVRERELFYQQHGIRSVPAIILNERHLISGGQPVEVFERALRQVAALEG